MRRREFLGVLGSAAAAWPTVAQAQNSPRRKIIGTVAGASAEAARPQMEAFRQGLSDLGYTQGVDYEIAYHSADGEMQLLPSLAQDVVRLKPDVILAAPTPAVVAAKAASAIIPIVSFMLADEVRLGLVASDARPGGNVTGLAMRVEGMSGKQFELALEIIPGAKRVGVLVNIGSADVTTQLHEIEAASVALKVGHVIAKVGKPDDIAAAVQSLAAERVDLVVVLYDALFYQERIRLASYFEAARLPSVFGARDHVAAGGLMSYGISLKANAYRAASYIDKIFKGAKPADLPVEFPTKLELVINLKTAKTFGLDVPLFLQQRADEVIE
jgi:putative ABC transport system substrate-binding protein